MQYCNPFFQRKVAPDYDYINLELETEMLENSRDFLLSRLVECRSQLRSSPSSAASSLSSLSSDGQSSGHHGTSSYQHPDYRSSAYPTKNHMDFRNTVRGTHDKDSHYERTYLPTRERGPYLVERQQSPTTTWPTTTQPTVQGD